MKVLVTGGAGYIGSHTCVTLLQAGIDIVVLDNFSNSKPEVIDRIGQISGREFAFYEGDILDRECLQQIFREHHIDAVVHFAGWKAVGESVAQPLKYYHNNVSGSIVLAQVMQEFDCHSIVFSSSATVYGMKAAIPYLEQYPTDAYNPYGQTKQMIERIFTDLQASDERWSVLLLRYFNPIGAHPSGLIGEDPQGIPNNLMPYLCRVAAGILPCLPIYGDDYPTHDGTGVRDYIHVMDLAQGHTDALLYGQEHPGVHIYNLGTGVGYSVLDLVNTFREVNQVEVPYQITDRRPGDLASYYADASKAERELHWKTRRSLEDMCKDSWHYMQMQQSLK